MESKTRDVFGRKVNSGRKEGLVPAVIYGRGVESKSLWINALDLKRLLAKSGESVIIELDIDKKDRRNVIIHEMQENPVSGKYMHIDFYQVRMDEKIETEVELVFVGEAPAVKAMGGVLIKTLDKVTVKCLPADLPSHIDIDISKLETFENHIYVKDISIQKVEIDLDPETVIASVAPPRSEEELSQLDTKVEEDVTKVEGVVKEEPVKEEK